MNQYLAIASPTTPPHGARSHDLRGNLISNGSQSFTCDSGNRLLSSTSRGNGNVQRVNNSYDSRSQRITRRANGETTLYIYDQWNVIAEYTRNRRGNFQLSTRYTWGNDLSGTFQGAGGVGGLLIAEHVSTQSNIVENEFYHYDANGNVTELTNAEGRKVARYRYDAFG